MSKVISLTKAALLVQDGDAISTGGSLLHRNPSSLLREIIRQNRKNLTLIKHSPGYDADILCASKTLQKTLCGIVTFESEFGLAPNYRKSIEKGLVGLTEHA